MASFAEQVRAARDAHNAATAVESTVRQQIVNAFFDWESGDYDAQTIRHRLENIVRTAYRSAAVIAAENAHRQAGIQDWYPQEQVFNTKYLKALLFDVRKNLREYKKSDKGEAARRRAVLRMQLSAAVAAQRGYTDSTISAYKELEDFGYNLRKVWMANFVNNEPCAECVRLHGTEVGLHEDFPLTTLSKLKVYQNLQGPPRHPNCRCYLVVLIVQLENAFDSLDIQKPSYVPFMMSTDQVKRMPMSIFKAVVVSLQKIITKLRGL